ncbi:MAG: hypothetical protein RIC51_05900 [Erythrobacter sp.]|uniref:hypothetical protein n=1 Tax=Erythrobacter sp. TaxID=1042 RepID=UPI0032EBC723
MTKPRSTAPISRDPNRPILRNKRAVPRQATSTTAFEIAPPAPDDPLLDFVPVPHVSPRRNSITPDVQRAFITHLAATGIVKEAARHVGKSLEALYKLRQRPGAEGFRAAWDAALDRAMTRLEDSALARALHGEEKPILHRGEIVGSERRYNDALVMFFLRARLADRYAPSAHIAPGHPVYERIRREIEEENRERANDPAQIARVRAAIDAKVRAMALDLERAVKGDEAEAAAAEEDGAD